MPVISLWGIKMYYYSPSTKGFYLRELHGRNVPEDAINISEELYTSLMEGQESGKNMLHDGLGLPSMVDRVVDIVHQERQWRDSELIRVDIEIFKVQDSDQSSVGTVGEWREYRKSLRNWPECGDFPNPFMRPSAPDYKE